MNNSNLSLMNRAITHGAEHGDFVLPKGPSGKVKLAPKKSSSAAKEVRFISIACHLLLILTLKEYQTCRCKAEGDC